MTPGVETAARLDATASQATFRTLLDVVARPGSVAPVQLPHPDLPPALLVLLALADVETTVAVIGDPSWADLVRDTTGARIGELEHADLVAALRPPRADEITRLRTGNHLSPERGAVLSIGCEGFGAGTAVGPLTRLTLSGPGVQGRTHLEVAGVGEEPFHALQRVNRGYPAGVDTWLVSANWAAALPRSCQIEVAGVSVLPVGGI